VKKKTAASLCATRFETFVKGNMLHS
jgi:hypothetical protein